MVDKENNKDKKNTKKESDKVDSVDESINFKDLKEGFKKTFGILKQKKVLNLILIFLLLSVLITGTWIRVNNLDSLKDQTTGEYLPTALDPYYFLRFTEAIKEQGGLPEYDEMRYHPVEKTVWNSEIWPYFTNPLHKIIQIFDSDATLRFTAIIFPVIFFVLGLIAFFFLILVLTNSKIASLTGTAFLAFIPTYFYRTYAGFYDHESNGMFVFFLTLMIFTLALKFLNKKKERENKEDLGNEKSERNRKKSGLYPKILFFLRNQITISVILGLIVGLLTAFTIVSWGGVSNYLFMIFPLAFGIFWLVKVRNINIDEDKKELLKLFVFYISFFIFTIISGLILGYSFEGMIQRSALNSSSILNGLVLLFVVADFSIIKNIKRIPLKSIEKYRILYSLSVVIILGFIGLFALGKNPFSMVESIFERILKPFGTGRVGLTVAENRQPYLGDWINQTGNLFFWLFLGGLFAIGASLSKFVKNKKRRFGFIFVWILLISGILFSRISSGHLFDGENFISKLFYFGSILVFIAYSIRLYLKEKVEFPPELIVIFSWTIFMLISARGAIRLFHVFAPFVCFLSGYLIYFALGGLNKKRDELVKMLFIILFSVVVILAVVSLNNFLSGSVLQSKGIGPGANPQWQEAMSWVRDNTSEDSVFAHWWDYGYWVQYLGERRTIADGGQFQGSLGNHLLGRYLLTNPNPNSALSFMKTNDITHLLIDPTDIGKYTAFSTIGSNAEGEDRQSWIPVLPLDSSQTQEEENVTKIIFVGGQMIDSDVIYEQNGEEIFLPKEKAGLAGITLEYNEKGNSMSFSQPKGVFVYNNQRYDLPLKSMYYEGEIFEFQSGVNSTVRIIPGFEQTGEGTKINPLGAAIYLSEKTRDTLFSQLYLLDDVNDRYPTITTAHIEDDIVVEHFKQRGVYLGDFVYYNGIRGPLKIWDVEIPENIIEREEFLERGNGEGRWGEFDGMEFTK